MAIVLSNLDYSRYKQNPLIITLKLQKIVEEKMPLECDDQINFEKYKVVSRLFGLSKLDMVPSEG